MNIVNNKKIFFNYFIEEKYGAGIVLEGWEVKAIRAGRVQIKEAYIAIRNGEIFLFNAHISALISASTNAYQKATRARKLLLNLKEINKLIGKVKRSNYTIVPINLHYNKNRIKCEIALAKGKKEYDKRESKKKRDSLREIQTTMKQNQR